MGLRCPEGIANSIGPSTEPWGTPQSKSRLEDHSFPTHTNWLRLIIHATTMYTYNLIPRETVLFSKVLTFPKILRAGFVQYCHVTINEPMVVSYFQRKPSLRIQTSLISRLTGAKTQLTSCAIINCGEKIVKNLWKLFLNYCISVDFTID